MRFHDIVAVASLLFVLFPQVVALIINQLREDHHGDDELSQ